MTKFNTENTPPISKRTTLLRIDVQCEERRRRARRSAASRNGHSDSNAARSSAAELDVTTFPNTSRPSDVELDSAPSRVGAHSFIV